MLANDKTRQALMDLYAGNDKVSEAFRQGAGSRMQSAQELMTEKVGADERRSMALREGTRAADKAMDHKLDRDGTPANAQAQNAQMLAASNGASEPIGLQLDAHHLGTLMPVTAAWPSGSYRLAAGTPMPTRATPAASWPTTWAVPSHNCGKTFQNLVTWSW